MALISSFPPVVLPTTRVLVLGSMPGEASLAASAYYAHPRNGFWPILGSLLGFSPALPYAQRLEKLRAAGIGLWDVLAQCERVGSLDAAIRSDTLRTNDFVTLFAQLPQLQGVFFNGATAERYFRKLVAPKLPVAPSVCVRLPSTSPAHAGWSLEKKRDAWAAAILPLLSEPRR